MPGATEPPPDLGCIAGPHAATWRAVKERFRSLFPSEGPPTAAVSREKLQAVLDDSMRMLKESNTLSPEAAGECGLGRLALQMLTLTTIEDPMAIVQVFSETERLASPVLTFLLDVNWVLLGQSGWPMFGFLAQISLRKQNDGITLNDEGDGLDAELSKKFFAELKDALVKEEYEKVIQSGSDFLSSDAPAGNSPIGALTAFASQAMALPAAERVRVLQEMQTAFGQMIGGAAELDISLSTRWPLWGLTHAAIDPFFA